MARSFEPVTAGGGRDSRVLPPVDRMIEEDNRVQHARPIDKPALREWVRQKLTATFASVRDVRESRSGALLGRVQLSNPEPHR